MGKKHAVDVELNRRLDELEQRVNQLEKTLGSVRDLVDNQAINFEKCIRLLNNSKK